MPKTPDQGRSCLKVDIQKIEDMLGSLKLHASCSQCDKVVGFVGLANSSDSF